MLVAHLRDGRSGSETRLLQVDRMRMVGRVLLAPRFAALYKGAYWIASGIRITSIEIEPEVFMRFETGGAHSSVFGPYAHAQIEDGFIRTQGERFASFNRASGMWQSAVDNHQWRVVEFITAAGASLSPVAASKGEGDESAI